MMGNKPDSHTNYRCWRETNPTHSSMYSSLRQSNSMGNSRKKSKFIAGRIINGGLSSKPRLPEGSFPPKIHQVFLDGFFPPDSARGPAPPWPPQYAPRARCGRRSPTSNFRPGPGHLDMPGTIGWMGWQPVEALCDWDIYYKKTCVRNERTIKNPPNKVGIPTVVGGKWCDCNGLRLDDWYGIHGLNHGLNAVFNVQCLHPTSVRFQFRERHTWSTQATT